MKTLAGASLKQFLKRDENFLGILLALTNLSQEKFLRILTAQRFAEKDFGKEWGAKENISHAPKRRRFC